MAKKGWVKTKGKKPADKKNEKKPEQKERQRSPLHDHPRSKR